MKMHTEFSQFTAWDVSIKQKKIKTKRRNEVRRNTWQMSFFFVIIIISLNIWTWKLWLHELQRPWYSCWTMMPGYFKTDKISISCRIWAEFSLIGKDNFSLLLIQFSRERPQRNLRKKRKSKKGKCFKSSSSPNPLLSFYAFFFLSSSSFFFTFSSSSCSLCPSSSLLQLSIDCYVTV